QDRAPDRASARAGTTAACPRRRSRSSLRRRARPGTSPPYRAPPWWPRPCISVTGALPPPSNDVARVAEGERQGMTDRLQLIGAEASYYTGKGRAYLRWKALPFDEVLATAQVYRELILPRTGVSFIPVVVTPEGDTLQDSTAIIDALEQRVPEPSVYPRGPIQRLVALLLE